MQGKLSLAEHPQQILTCMLGSCISACFRDRQLGLGGMNHFLMPGGDPRHGANVRYGAQSMEELINALLRKGAERRRLEVWLFGGASVLGTQTGIGAANCAFAMDFVRTEGFTLMGHDLGGTSGRRVRFNPATGDAQVTKMSKAPVETSHTPAAKTSDIELF